MDSIWLNYKKWGNYHGIVQKKEKIHDPSIFSQFAQLYLVKLLFEDVIEERTTLLGETLVERFHEIKPITKIKGLASYALPKHKVVYKYDKEIPSQLICCLIQEFEQSSITKKVLNETWISDDPRELLGRCNHMLIAGDKWRREEKEIISSIRMA